ncbi:hypothetical protein CS022_16910 [Veronia nyctiphanis]|uniref:Uncharacterized protein n=1 Tax=Veronia nyctiphanis TaxID=1278244 RepID=A0A4Q0YMW2_9GAMM|nr:hypothetical protein [Veronia nyctiphanis]RXJ72230.1 hypothetical protein CS022_16910 [Veronia nyctiphanis]
MNRIVKSVIAIYLILFTQVSIGSDKQSRNTQDQLPSDKCESSLDEVSYCFSGGMFAGSAGTQAGVRNYALKQFYALNWPVKDLESQSPNIDIKPAQFDILIWQTWRNKDDLNSITRPKLTKVDINNAAFLANSLSPMTTSVFNSHIEFLHDIYVPEESNVSDKSIVTSGKSEVYYQVYYNSVAVTDLKSKKFVGFTTGKSGVSYAQEVRGAILVKAAWRLITDLTPEEQRKYHTSLACIFRENSSCKMELVGLLGLHVANKSNPNGDLSPKDNDLSTWTWSTYEYRYNAPTVVNKKDFIQSYLINDWDLFDKNISKEQIDSCFNGEVLDPTSTDCIFNKSKFNIPSNIIRTFPSELRSIKIENLDPNTCEEASLSKDLDKSTCTMIAAYNDLEKKSPLENYRLIDSIWMTPDKKIKPSDYIYGTIDNTFRNTSMEPFINFEESSKEVLSKERNCISCHQRSKYDGMFTVKKIINGDK